MDETPGALPASPPAEPAAPPALATGASTASPGPSTPGPADRPSKRISRFDKLWEPVRRFMGGSSNDTVAPAGTVTRKKHRDPRVLFVCTGNAARSQMAEAFALQEGLYAESAGTWPAPAVPQEVVEAMQEKGFDLSQARPKLLDPARLGAFDRVILFEARIPDAAREGARIEEWNDVWDPTGLPLEGHRLVASELEKRIGRLAKHLKGKQAKAQAVA